VGRKSALEEVQRIAESLHGSDMVFITAGLGGGTGTGAAPIISQIARDQGALTVAVVTKPFSFEGTKRARNAEEGLQELAESVDTIISIPNDKLLTLAEEDMPMLEAFRRADDVLLQAVRGISDLIVTTGMINVDFADVRTIMSATGRALMGTGYGKGERRASEAALQAINSPLLDDVSVDGATGILINFTAGTDIRLSELNEANSLIKEAAAEDANIIWGIVTDPQMSDTVKVTVIATGFEMRPHSEERVRYGHVGLAASGRLSTPTTVAHSDNAAKTRSSAPPARTKTEQRDVIARPSRRPAAQPEQVTMPEISPVRAFGATAIHDEAVLDIPAYLRRNNGMSSTASS
jgi:cell division protein FtsZ